MAPTHPDLPACPSRIRSARPVKTVAVLVLVALAAGVGVLLHAADRTAGDTWHSVGTDDPDRIEVPASVQRVDAGAREVVLRAYCGCWSRRAASSVRTAGSRRPPS
ncbi:hypothetical protein [Amycolatopsis sp.]|uniref:hypothetical protein n=1 Tax=Amycolatopsis sp. TaxID=37632 RepID=UPI002E04A7D8|nr:hypothetical protein [Amycolatopsis sp.]